MPRTEQSRASIEYTEEENDDGYMNECVYAECLDSPSDHKVGPFWGQEARTVRAALARLSEDCDCGNAWHEAEEGEDEDDNEDLY